MSFASVVFQKFRRSETGSVTAEFCIALPVLLSLFFSMFETGLLMTRYVMLDRSMDIVVRAMRLDTDGGFLEDDDGDYTISKLKTAICDRALMFQNCDADLRVEMIRISEDDWDIPGDDITCSSRTETVADVTLTAGEANDVMFFRACMTVDVWFPWAALGAQLKKNSADGTHKMIAISAFAVEPV